MGAKLSGWHVFAVAGIAAACLLLLAIIGREMYYAAHPDKRPKRRKRRRPRHTH